MGVVRALEPRDLILTNHRSAGHLLARGADAGRMIAEVMGRADGYCKGRSGSLHISVEELGVVLTSTIVGGELSLAPGVALSQKMGAGRGRRITAVFFGDGAACEGIFHESLNLAVTWQLPILYVCENNQWQAYVRGARRCRPRRGGRRRRIAAWARGPRPARRDRRQRRRRRACRRARSRGHDPRHGGPHFLELVTYRLRGHFEPDDQAYVDAAELAPGSARSIARAAQRLLDEKVMAPAASSRICTSARAPRSPPPWSSPRTRRGPTRPSSPAMSYA